MKALVYTDVEEMTFQNEPDPVLEEGENLIRVVSVGICGSDMHGFLGHDERRPAPLILGHEAAGDVIEGPMKGKRVTVNPLVTCDKCEACVTGREHLCAERSLISMKPRQGAFSELLKMPSSNLVEVPDHVDFDHAALTEPLAVCWHAVKLGEAALFFAPVDAKCLIIGGGAIGLGTALALRARGYTNISISEPNEKRHDMLRSAGDFNVYSPLQGHPDGVMFDIVFDAVGFAGTRADASALVKPGGVIVHIGLGDSEPGLDVRRITLQEVQFIGTYCYTKVDFAETAQGIYDGIFGDLTWHQTRPLAEGHQAFVDILAGAVAEPKVILKP